MRAIGKNLLLILLLFSMLGSSCRRKDPPEGADIKSVPGLENMLAPKAPSSSAISPAPANLALPESPALKEGIASADKIETPVSPPSVPKNETRIPNDVRGMDALAVFKPLSKIYPSDFSLGALKDPAYLDASEKPFIETARSFVKRLISGEFAKEFVAPELRPMLGSLIRDTLDANFLPETFRLGSIATRSDGTVSVNLRLKSGIGRTEGEIVFERRSGSIFIVAFLVDLSMLRTAAAQAPEFEPDTYSGYYP